MRLIIENKIDISNINIRYFNYLKSKCILMNVTLDEETGKKDIFVLEQKVDLPAKTLTTVMQTIEWHSIEPLIIRWFPDPKFYMYTEDYFFKVYKK